MTRDEIIRILTEHDQRVPVLLDQIRQILAEMDKAG